MAQPDSVSYLLPHEVAMVSGVLADFNRQRDAAVTDAAEALQVSGDWYENGPVEAAREEANHRTAMAVPYAAALLDSVRVGYPDVADRHIQLGSYARVRLAGERLGCMLVGMMAPYKNVELPEDPSVEDIMPVTHTSPLGAALIGATVGAQFAFTGANGLTLSGKVEEIDQELIAQTYGASEAFAQAA